MPADEEAPGPLVTRALAAWSEVAAAREAERVASEIAREERERERIASLAAWARRDLRAILQEPRLGVEVLEWDDDGGIGPRVVIDVGELRVRARAEPALGVDQVVLELLLPCRGCGKPDQPAGHFGDLARLGQLVAQGGHPSCWDPDAERYCQETAAEPDEHARAALQMQRAEAMEVLNLSGADLELLGAMHRWRRANA